MKVLKDIPLERLFLTYQVSQLNLFREKWLLIWSSISNDKKYHNLSFKYSKIKVDTLYDEEQSILDPIE